MTSKIYIVRGRYTERGVSHYFDIEFFETAGKARKYLHERLKHKEALGEPDIDYYIYETEAL